MTCARSAYMLRFRSGPRDAASHVAGRVEHSAWGVSHKDLVCILAPMPSSFAWLHKQDFLSCPLRLWQVSLCKCGRIVSLDKDHWSFAPSCRPLALVSVHSLCEPCVVSVYLCVEVRSARPRGLCPKTGHGPDPQRCHWPSKRRDCRRNSHAKRCIISIF